MPGPLDPAAVEQAATLRAAIDRRELPETALGDWAGSDWARVAAAEAVTSSWAIFDHPEAGAAAEAVLSQLRNERQRRKRFRRRSGLLALAASIMFIFVLPWQEAAYAYSTPVGTGRTIVLSDGSRITLNGDSAVRLRFADDTREIWLDRGQARFEIARGARPFEVHAGTRQIVVLAGILDAELIEDKAVVTSMLGKAEISPDGTAGRLLTLLPFVPNDAVTLAAGQQLVADGSAAASLTAADLGHVDAWRNGQLVMANMTLGDAIARVNRQSPQRITLADPTLAQLTLSGVLSARDASKFANIVAMHLPLSVGRTKSGQINLARR